MCICMNVHEGSIKDPFNDEGGSLVLVLRPFASYIVFPNVTYLVKSFLRRSPIARATSSCIPSWSTLNFAKFLLKCLLQIC